MSNLLWKMNIILVAFVIMLVVVGFAIFVNRTLCELQKLMEMM
jgi:hypothetical protein